LSTRFDIISLGNFHPNCTWHSVQPFQTVAEDIFTWSVGPKRSVNPPLTALYKSSYLLIYLLTIIVFIPFSKCGPAARRPGDRNSQ